MASDNAYILQNIPGKGLGLVARARILKGTRIFSESPLVRVPRSTNGNSRQEIGKALSKDVSGLSEEDQKRFFSLHNAFEDEVTKELGIVRTNALPLGSDASTGGVFPEASRINHACIQNAQNTWNEDLQQLTIYAIRDIDKGEEITIMYLGQRTNRFVRQLTLQREFRFTCSCQLCALPESQRRLSDAILDEIIRLDGSIGDGMQIASAPLQALQNVRNLLMLSKEEGIDDATIPRAYYDAFQIAILNGDIARAKVFVERAATTRAVMEGDDSPTVRRYRKLARDPTHHSSYRYTSAWSTSIKDLPSGLSAEDFETWLWKEKKTDQIRVPKSPQEADQYADLRDVTMFPSFAALPGENDIDLEFYQSSDGFSYRPRKHWCFFAEIFEVEQVFRLRLLVKDKAGLKIPIAFYTSDRGSELDSSTVKKGHTVAVMYAEQHGFLDMTTGIRVEEPGVLKIFPVSLDELFKMSDRVQEFATKAADGERSCHGCTRKAANLKKCVRCGVFWYCGKACKPP